MPQKDTQDNVAYTCMLSFPIDVFHLIFNFYLYAATLVYLSQWSAPCAPPPPFIGGKAGKNLLNEEINRLLPLLPTGWREI